MSQQKHTPDWYEKSLENHLIFLKIAKEKGKLQTEDEICLFLALAICGEAGELANMYKKFWRGDEIIISDFEHKIKMEIADIYTYLKHLAFHMGFDLDEAENEKAEIVKNKLIARERQS